MAPSHSHSRRTMMKNALGATIFASTAMTSAKSAGALTVSPSVSSKTTPATSSGDSKQSVLAWDKVFPKSDKVDHKKVTFRNRYGIALSADLYMPKKRDIQKLPALVLSGPFGAVKEQSSGLYAQTLAECGFVTLAFDPSFTGESGGDVRNIASPDISTEDFSAAVDYLGLLPSVDRQRIGAMAICGLSGMALTAASCDSRIRAVATVSMYDMSRSISRGYRDSYTSEQRHQIIDYISQQRWVDAEAGSYAVGLHEIPFDAHGNLIKINRGLPEVLPANPNPVLAAFFDYYRTKRGFHPRSINSTTAWTVNTPMSFFAFSLMDNIAMIAPRPVLFVVGANAHSRYYAEDVYQGMTGPKEMLVVPNADHVDMYDRMDKIPFTAIEAFFRKHL